MKPYVFKQLKRPKYGNSKCTWMGETFDSILERDRWIFLQDAQRAGRISRLARQVRIKLESNGQHIATYVADHCYFCHDAGRYIVEDCKSPVTAAESTFRLKAKLYKAQYGNDIYLVTKATLTSLPCP